MLFLCLMVEYIHKIDLFLFLGEMYVKLITHIKREENDGLNVVANEKQGGPGSWQMIDIGLVPC
jgi:hypothetical protein